MTGNIAYESLRSPQVCTYYKKTVSAYTSYRRGIVHLIGQAFDMHITREHASWQRLSLKGQAELLAGNAPPAVTPYEILGRHELVDGGRTGIRALPQPAGD
jgi:hypothetical protein